MSKKETKPEGGKPTERDNPDEEISHTETGWLSGPISVIWDKSPPPCRLTLSHEALKAANMAGGDQVEVTARPGEILIRRIGGPLPSVFDAPKREKKPNLIDHLMDMTKEWEAKQKAARGQVASFNIINVPDEDEEESLE
ncbi:MAG: hypothetical protein QUS09_03650 [Methanotrichaceae archaeon]|nr:hypothetical protein [Methanotrichaceae archaeon]